MNTQAKNDLATFLRSFKGKAVIISHTSPDGDALGSSLAMKHALTALGLSVSVVLPDDYPDYYAWLPGINDVIVAKAQPESAARLIEEASLQIIVDMNALSRAQQLEPLLRASHAKRVLIDHHLQSQDQFDMSYADTAVSSTSELVYSLIEFIDKSLITTDVASCLYTGIVTDTGNFFHGNMTPETFTITADILAKGVDIVRINQLVYNTFSEDRLRLLGFSISERLRVLHQHHAAYIFLSKDDLQRFNYQEGDTEDIVNYGLSIKGINISALFYEKSDFIKISLRSEGDVNVNAIAVNYFKGGGHRNASGAHFYGSMDEAIKLFQKALEEL